MSKMLASQSPWVPSEESVHGPAITFWVAPATLPVSSLGNGVASVIRLVELTGIWKVCPQVGKSDHWEYKCCLQNPEKGRRASRSLSRGISLSLLSDWGCSDCRADYMKNYFLGHYLILLFSALFLSPLLSDFCPLQMTLRLFKTRMSKRNSASRAQRDRRGPEIALLLLGVAVH